VTRVFISYHQKDTARLVRRLDMALVAALGRNRVYRDVESIQPSVDWLEAVKQAVRSSDVVLAVLGHGWLKRIASRRDPVRIELSTALSMGIPVIPLLIDGVEMPRAEELPLDVAAIERRAGLRLRSGQLDSDLRRVVQAARSQRNPERRKEVLRRLGLREARRVDLIGTWISQNPGDAILQHSFYPDGTYEFAGTLRQERASGSMLFEWYHAGEFIVGRETLRLLPFRSDTSRRDPDFPDANYVSRPERVKNVEYRWRLQGTRQNQVLTLWNRAGQTIPCRRIHRS
jgi:TIR domain